MYMRVKWKTAILLRISKAYTKYNMFLEHEFWRYLLFDDREKISRTNFHKYIFVHDLICRKCKNISLWISNSEKKLIVEWKHEFESTNKWCRNACQMENCDSLRISKSIRQIHIPQT